jgi:hypothetical protein
MRPDRFGPVRAETVGYISDDFLRLTILLKPRKNAPTRTATVDWVDEA